MMEKKGENELGTSSVFKDNGESHEIENDMEPGIMHGLFTKDYLTCRNDQNKAAHLLG